MQLGNAMTSPNKSETTESGKTKSNKTKPASKAKQSMAGARLRKHADFQRAYAGSRKRQSASMSWFLASQPGVANGPDRHSNHTQFAPSGPRVGLTAGKVLGKAHERNRIKRRLREALRRHLDLLPAGSDLILHPRRAVLTIEFTKLEAEIVRILKQAKAEAAQGAVRSATGPHA